jgi:hypothetical protein
VEALAGTILQLKMQLIMVLLEFPGLASKYCVLRKVAKPQPKKFNAKYAKDHATKGCRRKEKDAKLFFLLFAPFAPLPLCVKNLRPSRTFC